MEINIDWNKEFQEFQDILNSGLHPEWLYSAKANLVLVPAYTGEGKQYFFTKDILEASKVIPFF
ncbi:hypothetical protein N9R04_03845 [Staphylococcus sp. SQ8-PEA]|uniref:Uncharacterized protein n=1 Tax=Staphylococcus marylandisciuri TaxID=2981529 RepID=A0ABT2QPF5_9STAP|nr:hypothetical protein [Staphylococcus marylandisciuri]MCU5745854.1 hypothetical protein [Staphylococcus marylandisciuri]